MWQDKDDTCLIVRGAPPPPPRGPDDRPHQNAPRLFSALDSPPLWDTLPFEPRDSRPELGTPAHRCIKSPSKRTSKKVSRGRLTVVLISISPSPRKANGHAPDPPDLSRGCRDEGAAAEGMRKSFFFVDF